MHLTINEPRNVALCLVEPSSGKVFNWGADTLESPLVPAKHLRPAAAVGATTGPTAASVDPIFAALKVVDVGQRLHERPGLVPVWVVVDSSGNPTGLADVWSNPNMGPYPIFGGASR